MFYFMEAMTQAGVQMGLPHDQAHQLAVATFIGAGELARASTEPPSVLRERVTSKGGTTYAAISSMEHNHVKELFAQALFAAHRRAGESWGASLAINAISPRIHWFTATILEAVARTPACCSGALR